MTTQNRQEFIARTRRLAAAFIQASDAFNALASELTYTHLGDTPENGGLMADDFIGTNADLTPAQLLSFYAMLGAVLAPLTTEQKEIIYAVKGSSTSAPIPPPPLMGL